VIQGGKDGNGPEGSPKSQKEKSKKFLLENEGEK